MNRDRGDAIAGTDDGLDTLLAEVVPHEVVADTHELCRDEPDLVAAAQQHRVLGREPKATVDGDEPVVRANVDAGHAAGDRREHRFGSMT